MRKIIIKNCPAKPIDIKATYGWCSTYQIKCQDYTDCLLKKILLKIIEFQKDCYFECGGYNPCAEIGFLCDIEEVNDEEK